VVNLALSASPEPVDRVRSDIRRALGEGRLTGATLALGWGDPDVREAVGRTYGVAPERILPTTGCSSALVLAYRAFARAGDRVLVETPRYPPLALSATAFGLCVDSIERRGEDFSIDPERLEAALRPDTKLIVVSNLHNPSGARLDEGVLARLARVAASRGIRVVVDEIYRDFTFGEVPRPAATIADCVVSLNSLTKVYGLGTLRCGWIVASDEAIQQLRFHYANFEAGVSPLTHAIAANVIESLEDYRRLATDRIGENRPLAAEFAATLEAEGLLRGAPPAHASMFFPRIEDVHDTRPLAQWLADEFEVLVTPGDFFGAPQHARISFSGDSSALAKGLDRLAQGLRVHRERGGS
jgi:aspartate/methionine/tyrosine aminotransferase